MRQSNTKRAKERIALSFVKAFLSLSSGKYFGTFEISTKFVWPTIFRTRHLNQMHFKVIDTKILKWTTKIAKKEYHNNTEKQKSSYFKILWVFFPYKWIKNQKSKSKTHTILCGGWFSINFITFRFIYHLFITTLLLFFFYILLLF